MTKEQLEEIVIYIVNQGLKAIRENTDEQNLPVDYIGIFAKDDKEYEVMDNVLKTIGKPGDKTATASGSTYLLDEPIQTPAGPLKVLKARKSDPTRPQRGAPDFRVANYAEFKEKNLRRKSNFSLMLRKDYEMMELKGEDVLVYFPSKPFDVRQKL